VARGIFAAGGGKGGRTAAVAEQRTERRQRRKRKGISRGLVYNFRKLQGPFGKEELNHCSRVQTKMWPKLKLYNFSSSTTLF
jgi:hypothetical protein